MKEVLINTEYIQLHQFLKLASIVSTGGEAKFYLQENEVFVNSVSENRRGRKLYSGDVIKTNRQEFVIKHVD